MGNDNFSNPICIVCLRPILAGENCVTANIAGLNGHVHNRFRGEDGGSSDCWERSLIDSWRNWLKNEIALEKEPNRLSRLKSQLEKLDRHEAIAA